MINSINKTIFVAVVSLALVVSGCSKKEEVNASPQEKSVAVVVQKVRQMKFHQSVEVSGSVFAVHTALVSARVDGIVDEIYVDEGDNVISGKTKLFQTDRLTLEKNYESSLKLIDVQKSAINAAKATVNRIEADLEKARLDADRYQRLFDQQAISKNSLELQQSKLKQLTAALAEARAGVGLAESQLAQAVSNSEIAAKNLSDSLAIAPITATVATKSLENGERASKGQVILELVDLEAMEVKAFLPARYYADVLEGKTRVRILVSGRDLGEFVIDYKSPVVDPRLRVFEIKASMGNSSEKVVPGELVKMSVILQSKDALGVASAAFVTRNSKQCVFVYVNNSAKLVEVNTGLETDGYVEIVGDNNKISIGEKVVTVGKRFCEDGGAVKIVQEVE